MRKNNMRVGVVRYRFDFYPYTRNIVGFVPAAEYVPVDDLTAWLNRAARRLNGWLGRELVSTFDLNNRFQDFNLNKVDLVHLFNGVSYGRTPWVSTFETILPRFRSALRCLRGQGQAVPSAGDVREIERALQALAGPACRRIIALSGCTAGVQKAFLTGFSEFRAAIERKMVVLHPPQPVLVDRSEDKQVEPGGEIRLLFVGHAFFRKGGLEMLETLVRLRAARGYNLRLTVVSSLRLEPYAIAETDDDLRRARTLLTDNRDWIRHHDHLPNDQVLALMKASHIGLLPTYADTYGYSLLEFQAAGCPVISTDVRALPEINNPQVGWLIPVPRDHLGEALYRTEEERRALCAAVSAGLERALDEIFSAPQAVAVKAENAVRRIRQDHSPEAYARQLQQVYQEAAGA
jgi:glycosyltransferase involved in cell wall biosynthesis